VKVLLDEMYPATLAEALESLGIEAVTAVGEGLAGLSDDDLFEEAVREGRVLLTENVSDFSRIAAQRLAAGEHHHGLLIALSSRFSRRPKGVRDIASAVRSIAVGELEDRTVYVEAPLS